MFGLTLYLLATAGCLIRQSASFQHTFKFLFTFNKSVGDVLCILKLFSVFTLLTSLFTHGLYGESVGMGCLEA